MAEHANWQKQNGDERAVNGAGQPLEELIRRRAYELYLERGPGSGNALEDWLRAEREACGR